MIVKTGRFAVLLLIAFGLASVGCVSQAQQLKPTLRVGVVNLDRVLQQNPEYRQYSDLFAQDRDRLLRDVVAGAGNDPKAWDKILKDDKKKQEIEQTVQKWDETRRKFLDKVTDQVRTAANQVARDKQIDIVLMNAPWYPTRQQMAVDITADVMFVLSESGKAAR